MNANAEPLARVTPWSVRRAPPHPVARNTSPEPLCYARALIRVGDDVTTEYWGTVLPGDEQEICLCGLDAADLCITLTWRRAGTDEELLWQFVL